MQRILTCVALCAAVLFTGCDTVGDSSAVQNNPAEDVAEKGSKRVAYEMEWPIGALDIPCLDQTVNVTGYSIFTGTYLITPSGNYVDMAMFDFDTDAPYAMEFEDGTVWPMFAGADNSLILEKAKGSNSGIVTVQANISFASVDHKNHVKYRAHYIADGIDWETGGLIGVRRQDDVFTCHVAD